jgi:hypothetical protein
VFAAENYETWFHPIDLPWHKESGPGTSWAMYKIPPMEASAEEPASARSYQLIAEKNIFSPERKEFSAPTGPPVPQKPVVRPQILLYGVAIGEGYQSATVVNPGRTLRKGERETLHLTVGEKIGEYRLAKIFPDRITMEGNGDTFEVLLYDSKNPKRPMEPRPKKEPGMIAGLQTAPAPDSGNTPNSVPFQESLEKPAAQVHARATALPSDEYDYLHGRKPPSASIKGRRIFYRTPGSSPQGSVEK